MLIQHCTMLLLQVDSPENLFSRVRKPSLKAPYPLPSCSLCQNGSTRLPLHQSLPREWGQFNELLPVQDFTLSWGEGHLLLNNGCLVKIGIIHNEGGMEKRPTVVAAFILSVNLLFYFPQTSHGYCWNNMIHCFEVLQCTHGKWFYTRRGVCVCMSSTWSHFQKLFLGRRIEHCVVNTTERLRD